MQKADFRRYLQDELLRRCRANPRYSLRAFARTLQTEPSFLSKILNGKRNITHQTLKRFGSRLNLHPKDFFAFETSLIEKTLRKKDPTQKNPRDTLLKSNQEYHRLALDEFEIISEWYHFAILELVSIPDYVPTPKNIASALGISLAEAGAAVDRLLRLGYLKEKSDGGMKNQSGNNTTLGNDFTAAAFRKLQRQILEKAIAALEATSIDRRSQTAMTMAIDSSLLPAAKKKINVFRRGLTSFLQKKKSKKDEVYHLSISLYPLTQLKEKKL